MTMSVLPWWILCALSLGLCCALLWQARNAINWQVTQQFIKEFLAMGLTLGLCALWVWKLTQWLTLYPST